MNFDDFEKPAILVVDDSELVAYYVGQLVGRMGFRVVLASNGQEALDRLAGEEFIAVVSDVEMPVMGGFEMARKTRLLYPGLPVVLISGSFDEERRRTALASGARDLLEKPVTGAQLSAALCLRSLPLTPRSPIPLLNEARSSHLEHLRGIRPHQDARPSRATAADRTVIGPALNDSGLTSQ